MLVRCFGTRRYYDPLLDDDHTGTIYLVGGDRYAFDYLRPGQTFLLIDPKPKRAMFKDGRVWTIGTGNLFLFLSHHCVSVSP